MKNETPAEKAFAKILDKMGVRYTKQKIVFHYKQYMIADFYLEEKGWLVEIDGEYHFTRKQMKKDKRRDQKIQKWFGYKILRFTNDEVLTGGKWIENVINHGFNDW